MYEQGGVMTADPRAVYDIQTALSTQTVASLFQERITRPDNTALRLMTRNRFQWSFDEPETSPFAWSAHEQPTQVVVAHYASRNTGGGMLRQYAAANAVADIVLEVWDRGSARMLRVTAPTSPGPKTCVRSFLNGLTEKDIRTNVKESVQHVETA